jgi:2'-5' RNA ligase
VRLFLSCNIPDKINSYLLSLAEEIHSLKSKELDTFAKLTIPKHFDLTMKFFGEVPEALFEDLKKCVESIHFPCFKASLQKIQVFNPERIRIIWVGVAPNEPFFALHKAVEEALLSLYPLDPRFSPHITLARVKSVHNRKLFLEKLQKIEVEPLSFDVDQLILFQSKTETNGAVHTPLFTVPLEFN